MGGLILSNGFGPFYCQGVEILRRIFVTVRDRDWREVAPIRWNCLIDEAAHTTVVEARHVSDLVDFEWQGTLRVGPDGRSLQFAFAGEARRTMDVCRLGLVVLHPVDAMLDALITAQSGGGTQTVVVSPTIAPQPIVDGMPAGMVQPFSILAIERADIGLLELEFEGDLFELEDQRNWGDATFKTYCTPLRLGFPRQVTKGARIAHRLDARFTPAGVQATASARQPPLRATNGIFPALGRIGGREPAGTREPDWHHLQIYIADRDDLAAHQAVLDRRQTLLLEIGVEDRRIENYLSELVAWFADHRARIARLLIYGSSVSPPSAVSITHWRWALDAAGLVDLPIFAATRGYFVEFNRSSDVHPKLAAGISFPLAATVHGDDPQTIAENVATIRDIGDTARKLAQSAELSVAPLALYYPSSPASPAFPRSMIAPWLTGTLIYAASAGVSAVTLADDIASTAPATLLHRLLGCSGLTVATLADEQPSGVHLALLQHPARDRAQIVGINLNDGPRELRLESLRLRTRSLVELRDGQAVHIDAAHIEIEAFGVRWLECGAD